MNRRNLAGTIMNGYNGGIDFEIFGSTDEEDVIKDVERLMGFGLYFMQFSIVTRKWTIFVMLA